MATVKELQQEIASLKHRISVFSDEVYLLKTELKKFKTDVASDVKYLTHKVEGTNEH